MGGHFAHLLPPVACIDSKETKCKRPRANASPKGTAMSLICTHGTCAPQRGSRRGACPELPPP
eukprot:6188264-Lingulodinium_polyedra.AAC.1